LHADVLTGYFVVLVTYIFCFGTVGQCAQFTSFSGSCLPNASVSVRWLFFILQWFSSVCCILDQETGLCAYTKSVVTCTSWMDEPLQECTCFQVHSVFLWSAVPTRLTAWSQGSDRKNITRLLCKVEFTFAVTWCCILKQSLQEYWAWLSSRVY